jgi:AcrR family transcriptional regulator
MDISIAPVVSADLWEMLPAGPRRELARAAASEFGKRGYHATTTRHIAEHVGMSPAGLYVHYASKAELLFTISRIGHESVLNESLNSIEGISTPRQRVHTLVRTFTIWHAVNYMLARVIQYELRALEPEHYKIIAAIRRRTEAFAADELRPLVSDPARLQIHTVGVLSLGIDTARWYNPVSSPAPEELGEAYADLVLQMLRK